MAEFKLDRIRYNWKDGWTPQTSYGKDDIVYYRGKTYACITAHTSTDDFFESYGTQLDIKVTVENETFYINGDEAAVLDLRIGNTYKFDVSDLSNLNTSLRFANTLDGIWNDGTQFENRVTISNSAGSENAYVEIDIRENTLSDLYYFNLQDRGYGNACPVSQATWRIIHDGAVWRGDWLANEYYTTGDTIKWKGYIYQCLAPHTSVVVTSLGPIADINKWKIVATTYNWLNRWETNSTYDLGDVVTYNGLTYICAEKHRSNASTVDGLEVDQDKWNIVSRSDDWQADWQTDYRYRLDDVVKYGGISYRCTVGHTSADNITDGLELDLAKWEIVNSGIEYKFDWQQSVRYKLNDIAKWGNSLWICTEQHTSTTTLRDDESYWQLWLPGLGYEELWSEGFEYKKGDIVLYGGYTYTALENNIASVPSINGIIQDTGDWELLKEGYKFQGEWSDDIQYRTGDVIRNQGYLYIAIDDNLNEYPDTGISWQILVTGRKWQAEWLDETQYFLGDIVTYESTSFICIQRHTSTQSDSRPDLDILNPDQNYWKVYVQGNDNNVLVYRGDLRVQDDIATARLPIGSAGAVLKALPTVGSDSTVGIQANWENFEEVDQVFYVAPQGVDSEESGLTLAAPFRTIKYACEYVKENSPPAGINTFGYNTSGNDVYALQRVLQLMTDSGDLSEASIFESFLRSTNPRTGVPYFDITSSGEINPVEEDAIAAFNWFGGYPDNTDEENLRIKDIVDYMFVNASNFEGEYILTSDSQEVAIAFQQINTTIFVKTGIYSEELPISIPRNTALAGDELRSTTVQPAPGSETSNMFYVNNGAGIRNMTLQGLYGQLGTDPNSFGTVRPTAGAYVSLDPGQGPNDTSVWITNKSPYIQNVTTFGTACVGLKVDGGLHNGGNDSVVANDFTQILSDGIGYWALRGGRSELVSVFTYYNYIGYLAESGGKVRATNGNNSYGTYGSRAEGVNPSEIPITAEIDNRSKQATIDTVHTNGSNLLAFAFDNAGQEYTQASLDIVGSNNDFSGVFNEFRDEALFQVRLIDPSDSSVPGGLNYQFLLNNAQGGDDRTIILAAADTTGTNEKYEGLRIFIESGKGAGQYGYISYYNELNKTAIISRDSDDSNGWDHIFPGYPIETELDSTTRYSIEPRSVVSEPEFFATSGDAGTLVRDIAYGADKWVAIQHNSNSYSYSADGISWTTNILPSVGNWNNITFANGVFIVTNIDDTTSYLTSNNGVDWTAGSFLTSGTAYKSVFGNDVWVAVETTGGGGFNTQRSINNGAAWTDGGNAGISGITDIAYGKGVFVAIKTNSDQITYSSNEGDTWNTTNLPISDTWTSITYGNGRFVIVGATDKTLYSFDGTTWYTGDIIASQWEKVGYGQGLFLAVASDSTRVAHSQDGRVWRTIDETSSVKALNRSETYTSMAFGNPNNSPYWVIAGEDTNNIEIVETGAKAFVRTKIASSRVDKFLIYDPGSGYKDGGITMSIYDPESTTDADYNLRLANGVIPQPEFVDRGTAYVRAIATITGNGFADNYQTGRDLVLKNLSREPGPGDNLSITGIQDVTYRVTKVNSVSGSEPTLTAALSVSPSISNQESPEHEESVVLRQEYSQIRLTGHDFLDIGTGSFATTRYPDLYLEGVDAENERQPFNEVTFDGGGRVFYTSTDQDGNFRVGELFEVEQNTGIVSINADFFELDGLSELSLGGIQVGGSAVVIREFSKERTFTANSNNIVPTQAAIIGYLESRISGGGSDAVTNTLIAGQVRINQNNMSTTSNLPINFLQKLNAQAGVDGHYLASMFYGANI